MGSRRTLILIGALAVGALAALLIFQYVGGIEEKAQSDAQMVTVVIAKAPIAKGSDAATLLASGAVGTGDRRLAELPSNTIKRVEEIKGQMAQIDIQPGTIITSSMFAADAAMSNGSVSTALKAGMVAVTTSTDQVKSVAGLVTQGDYVNLSISGNCTGSGNNYQFTGTAAGSGTNVECLASVFQKVRILAIGRSLGSTVAAPSADPAAPPTTAAPSSDLITFEVPQAAAQTIQLAGPGTLYMTLVRRDYVPAPLPITPYIPVDGVSGKTPYGGDPETKTAGQ